MRAFEFKRIFAFVVSNLRNKKCENGHMPDAHFDFPDAFFRGYKYCTCVFCGTDLTIVCERGPTETRYYVTERRASVQE